MKTWKHKLSFDHLSISVILAIQPFPLPCAVPFRENHGGPWGWNIGCCRLCRYQRATCGATCQPTSLSMPARLDRDPCFYRDFVIYISLRLPITNRDPCLLLRTGTSRYRAMIPFIGHLEALPLFIALFRYRQSRISFRQITKLASIIGLLLDFARVK